MYTQQNVIALVREEETGSVAYTPCFFDIDVYRRVIFEHVVADVHPPVFVDISLYPDDTWKEAEARQLAAYVEEMMRIGYYVFTSTDSAIGRLA